MRGELEKAEVKSLVISDFKCWWYRGEGALALAFLQNLHAVLSDTLPNKTKDLIPRLTQGLLQAGPVIGAAMAFTPAAPIAEVTAASISFAERFFPSGDTLENTFRKLSKILEERVVLASFPPAPSVSATPCRL